MQAVEAIKNFTRKLVCAVKANHHHSSSQMSCIYDPILELFIRFFLQPSDGFLLHYRHSFNVVLQLNVLRTNAKT